MKKLRHITIAALAVVFAGSLCLNWLLFGSAKSFYAQLQVVRLDPMGSRVYQSKSVTNADQSMRVVIVGDSRAAAWSPPENLQGYSFVNRAIGGQTTAQILGRLQADVLSLNPDVVLLQCGVNDLKSIPLFPDRKDAIISSCKTNFQSIVAQCAVQNVRVIISTIFPVGKPSLQRFPFWSPDVALSISDMNGFLKSLSSDNVRIFDSYTMLCGEDGLIRPEYCTDTLHLNDAGYTVINRDLTTLLQRALPTLE